MNKKQKIIYIYILLLPFIDVITSLMTRFSNPKLSLGMIVKGLTLVFSILYILLWSKSKWRRKSIMYLLILGIYFIIYTLCKSEIWLNVNYLNEITYAFKYFYFIVMLIGVFNIFDDLKIENEKLQKMFLITSIVYTMLLLIPYFTNTAFYSYNTSQIGGNNGWFYAANETGAITVLLLIGTINLLNNNKWHILTFVPILLSIAIIGTKVSYLGMIIGIITISIFNIIKNKKNGIILSSLLILILLGVCNFSPAMSNLEETNIRIEEKQNNISETKTIDDYIKNKHISKLVMLSLNGRDDFFMNDVILYSKINNIDKLFGLGWSYCSENDDCNFENKLVEIDYLDIFFHYGLIGLIIYSIPILYIIIIFFKSKRLISSYYYFIFFLLGLLISSIAGHVLSAPAVAIYLILITYMLNNSYYNNLNDKEITIMALHLGHGGIEKYISSLCNMLKDDYKINIIATYKVVDNPVYEFSNKIKIVYLIDNAPNKKNLINAIHNKNILNIIKESINSIKILYLKKKRNIKAIKNINSKYIITTRDFHNKLVGEYAQNNIIKIATEHNYHNNNKLYINKVKNSVRGFDYFVLVSNTLKEFYQDRVKGPKCVYIPNIIDNIPKKHSDLLNNNIIAIGRMEKEKGFDDLIDVVKIVKLKIKDLKLFLIGDGSQKESLEKKVIESDLKDTIIFTGYANSELIGEYLSKSKLYVMTSHTESFGIVLLEAMSYKVPCIAFDSADGARELLKNDVGILIKNRDKEKMANKIIELLNNKEEINKYSKNSFECVKNYLPDNVKEKWLNILK